jgi:hypothetical protein
MIGEQYTCRFLGAMRTITTQIICHLSNPIHPFTPEEGDVREEVGKREISLVLLLLYAHRHRSVFGAAGHIILTPANQLMEE